MMITMGTGRRNAAAQTKRGAMKKQIALAIVLALGAGTVALAETPEEQQACTNDAFQFCQNFIPDRNRVFTCLVNNRNQISAACHTVMAPYFPAEPVVALKKPPAPHEQGAKTKGPINLTPH
jgi:hypothetical protein